MPSQILVSNKSNVAQSEIMLIVDADHQWTKNESMQAWIDSGEKAEDWGRSFSLVIVTDRTKEELSFLLDSLVTEVDGELTAVVNKYYFSQPNVDSDLYKALLNTGQVSAPFSLVSSYIIERRL